jgi:hypothetical protein
LTSNSGNCFLWCAEAFEFDAGSCVHSCSYFLGRHNPIQKIIIYAYIIKTSPMFFCRNFKILGFKWSSLVHLELIFVQGPHFRLLQIENQFPQHYLLKRLSFLQCMFWLLCQKPDGFSYVGFFLHLLFCCIGLCVCCCASICYFCYCGSVVSFEVWCYAMSSIALFAQDYFCYSWLLCFHMNFGIDFPISVKNDIALNL